MSCRPDARTRALTGANGGGGGGQGNSHGDWWDCGWLDRGRGAGREMDGGHIIQLRGRAGCRRTPRRVPGVPVARSYRVCDDASSFLSGPLSRVDGDSEPTGPGGGHRRGRRDEQHLDWPSSTGSDADCHGHAVRSPVSRHGETWRDSRQRTMRETKKMQIRHRNLIGRYECVT